MWYLGTNTTIDIYQHIHDVILCLVAVTIGKRCRNNCHDLCIGTNQWDDGILRLRLQLLNLSFNANQCYDAIKCLWLQPLTLCFATSQCDMRQLITCKCSRWLCALLQVNMIWCNQMLVIAIVDFVLQCDMRQLITCNCNRWLCALPQVNMIWCNQMLEITINDFVLHCKSIWYELWFVLWRQSMGWWNCTLAITIVDFVLCRKSIWYDAIIFMGLQLLTLCFATSLYESEWCNPLLVIKSMKDSEAYRIINDPCLLLLY